MTFVLNFMYKFVNKNDFVSKDNTWRNSYHFLDNDAGMLLEVNVICVYY